MHKVSVVIPTYNRAGTLVRAIKSALNQTLAPHEVLVCDDGSTDDSRQQVEEMNSPLVKWIDCGRNGMPSVPRNTGIKNATGDWIAFLDSDDEWLPKKTEAQLEAVSKHALMACCTNAYRFTGEKNAGPYLAFHKPAIGFSDLLPVNPVICSSVLVSKKLLLDNYRFPEGKEHKAIEDYALWLRLSLQTDFAYLAEPLLNYNDEPAGSVRSHYTDVWRLREVIFTGLRAWLRENCVELNPSQQKELARAVLENHAKGKLSLWQRLKQKLT